jgi:8-oxo-dGTP diphosphatase
MAIRDARSQSCPFFTDTPDADTAPHAKGEGESYCGSGGDHKRALARAVSRGYSDAQRSSGRHKRNLMAESQFWIGVHGIIVDRGRLVVLRRAARMPYRPGHWDLPGGHLTLGESFEECLAREVGEETGLAIEIERTLGLYKAPPDPYVQALFACRPADTRRDLVLMPNEHVEGRWVTVEELARMSDVIPYLEGMLRRGMLDYLK